MGDVLGALFGWSVTAYLVWRAWPGIRGDLARIPRPERGKYSGGGRDGGF